MSLLDEVKTALRISDPAYDSEVRMWVDAAREDMERVGVDPDYMDDTDNALYRAAMCLYVKARFGYINPNSRVTAEERRDLEASYRQTVTDLMHSTHNLSRGDA